VIKVFVDSNVIVYANDPRDQLKQAVAIECVRRTIRDGSGAISTQVLMEYAAVAVSKLRHDLATVLRQLQLLESLEVVVMTPPLVRLALEIQARYRIGFWDASIIGAASSAGCSLLLSEDLNAGQIYAGVRVENPFATA
jgi:predicted nucleic acid-binding protein